MADTITYDDSKLRRFFAQMDPRTRAKALRGGLLRTANTVRKVARTNLMATGVHDAEKLCRGIRSRVERKAIGFAVSIKAKAGRRGTDQGEKGMHLNRQGLKKPVLGWLELGTVSRTIKSKVRNGRTRGAMVVKAPGGYITVDRRRGRLKPLRFMQKTKAQTEATVTHTMRDMVRDSVIKTAKRNGFT